jgi:hypothetical protein
MPANVRVVEMSHDDAWFRDTAPTFAITAAGDVRGVCWTFNAWGGLDGGCYASWALVRSAQAWAAGVGRAGAVGAGGGGAAAAAVGICRPRRQHLVVVVVACRTSSSV